jgi:GNAT superfamily N-acetyltransferase
MLELPASAYPAVRPLFQPLEHHLLVPALFEGQLEVKIFVDDLAAPRAALIAYQNRLIFGGEPQVAAFIATLQEAFSQTIIPQRKAAGAGAFVVYFSDPGWLPALEAVFSGFEIIHAPRQYYATTNPDPAPEIQLPEGFSLHLITPEFLESGVLGLEAVFEEMCSERTSVEDFLAHSFGICPVYGNEIAGWCLSEYNTNGRCEIGIATAEAHQRKGLATAITRAFLAEAARRGYTQIGWDCWTRNVSSAATARKAGFNLVDEYSAAIVLFV